MASRSRRASWRSWSSRCSAARGHEPERQVSIAGTSAPIGRVDFLIGRVVIEADSRAYHGDWVAADADRLRDLRLTAAGYRVVRVTWRLLVTQPDTFLAAIAAALDDAAA